MKKKLRENPTERRVRFDIFCKRCKYYEASASDDPCFNCLADTYGYSGFPKYYKGDNA